MHGTEYASVATLGHATGLFNARVAPGDAIAPGQDLGEIVDCFGRTVERFESQWSGIVLGVIRPAMVEGRLPLVFGTQA